MAPTHRLAVRSASGPRAETQFVDSIAASIASVIAMAGNEIRIAEPGEIMIHDAWSVAIGPASEMRAVAGRLDAVSSVADVYVARTGQSKDQIQAWMAAETTFQWGDAVKHGFAQTVMPNVKAAARQRPSAIHWRRVAPPAAQSAETTTIVRPLYDEKVQRLARQRARCLLSQPARAAQFSVSAQRRVTPSASPPDSAVGTRWANAEPEGSRAVASANTIQGATLRRVPITSRNMPPSRHPFALRLRLARRS